MDTEELRTLANVLAVINTEATALRTNVLTIISGERDGNGDNHPAARFVARQDGHDHAEEMLMQIARVVPMLGKMRAPHTTRDLIGR